MKIKDLNLLWIADITYVRMTRGFAYLTAILDAYSRRVIGWALSRSLNVEAARTALQMALANTQDC